MNDNTWIQELKAGDVVYVSKCYGELPKRATVARITSAQVVVALRGELDASKTYEQKYRLKDGRKISADKWHIQHLIKATPEMESAYKQHNMNREARSRIEAMYKFTISSTLSEQEAQDVIDFCAAMKDRLEARLKEVKV